MASESDGGKLSLQHGVRCAAESGASVEDVLVAIAEQVGGENIDSASRMNKAVVVFFKKVVFAQKIIASGIWVKDVFAQVTPLAAPATKVTISNVPPFIKNEAIELELARFGKFASTMKMIPLGCSNNELKHVMSFRRYTFMFLKDASRTLDVSFRVRHGERSFAVFASTGSLRCFECGDIGHQRRSCPHKNRERNGEMGEENLPTANDNERESEEGNGEPDGRSGGGTEPNERREESAVSGAMEAGIDDPLEGTSASSEQPQAAERSGRSKERGKGKRARRVWGEMEQSKERADDRGSDGCTPEKRTQENSGAGVTVVETPLSPCAKADTAGAKEAEVEMVCGETEVNKAPLDLQEEDEGELSDSSVVSDISSSQAGDGTYYNFEEICDFLDITKGKSVNISVSFPDGQKFLRSAKHYMKTVGMDVLSSQKRYRLKKHCTNVRKSLASLTF